MWWVSMRYWTERWPGTAWNLLLARGRNIRQRNRPSHVHHSQRRLNRGGCCSPPTRSLSLSHLGALPPSGSHRWDRPLLPEETNIISSRATTTHGYTIGLRSHVSVVDGLPHHRERESASERATHEGGTMTATQTQLMQSKTVGRKHRHRAPQEKVSLTSCARQHVSRLSVR